MARKPLSFAAAEMERLALSSEMNSRRLSFKIGKTIGSWTLVHDLLDPFATLEFFAEKMKCVAGDPVARYLLCDGKIKFMIGGIRTILADLEVVFSVLGAVGMVLMPREVMAFDEFDGNI